MKVALLILIPLMIVLTIVFMSVCAALIIRIGEIEDRMNSAELRANNLAEGMRIFNSQLRDIDSEQRRIRTTENLKERIAENVTQEQVDEARKRAKL